MVTANSYNDFKHYLSINKELSLNPIWVIDDDIDFHGIIKTCFQRSQRSNELVHFYGAKEAFEAMTAVLDSQRPMPALVLTDINMPAIDGFDFLTEVRRHPRLKHIPIILMLSNSETANDVAHAEQLGANGYLVKSDGIKDYIEFFKNL